jgi:phenylpyruvate tautomerase PptA (4-oxalocrotonate tautomerase family)
MPSVLISVRKRWPLDKRRAIIEAVHQALVDGILIPQTDRTLRLQEFDPEDFAVSRGKSENFTLIEIDVFAGRSLTAKRRLYKCMVENLGALGIRAKDVKVVLREIPRENWGISGGVPASDVDLGFKINI